MANPFEALIVGLLLIGLGLILFWPQQGLIATWRKLQQKSPKVLGEDALKFIFETNARGHKPTLQEVAGILRLNGPQAERLMQAMQDQDFIQVEEGALRLTQEGERYALRVIRAHRLWERYLAEESGYQAAEWHTQAELYEHRLSPEEANSLSARLGHPTHDPHGDPIPTRSGEWVDPGGIALASLSPGETARITHIEDEPECVYDQLIAQGLYPGLEIQILEKSTQGIRFQANRTELALASLLAGNVSVIPIPQKIEIEAQVGDPLSVLRPGERGRVVSISPGCHGPERRRLMDLGILPDTLITAELKSPSGDPTAYRIRGALIAIRKDQASLIRIQPAHEQA
jgi:DtxR family Mn-dependent transcriptional regulator